MDKKYELRTKTDNEKTTYFFGNQKECADFECGILEGFDSIFDAVHDWSIKETLKDENKRKEIDIL